MAKRPISYWLRNELDPAYRDLALANFKANKRKDYRRFSTLSSALLAAFDWKGSLFDKTKAGDAFEFWESVYYEALKLEQPTYIEIEDEHQETDRLQH